MSAFLIDFICAYVLIPEMNSKWTIHVYYSELWMYHEHFYQNFDCFVAPLYHLFFGQTLQRLSGESLEALHEIEN
jgi:hypothetical protein